jgi:hypothetical protein
MEERDKKEGHRGERIVIKGREHWVQAPLPPSLRQVEILLTS